MAWHSFQLRASAAAFLLCAAAACQAHGQAVGNHPQPVCDPHGPPAIPSPPRLDDYRTTELMEDELRMWNANACPQPDFAESADDPELKSGCEHAFPGANRAACRHVCLTEARIRAALLTYQAVPGALRAFAQASGGPSTSCGEQLRAASAAARDEAVRALWECFGLRPLPHRLRLRISFGMCVADVDATGRTLGTCHQGPLATLEILGPLIPGGPWTRFALEDVNMGCGQHGLAVTVRGVPPQ